VSQLVLSREIFRPIDEVYAYHTDLNRGAEWWANLSDVRLVEGPGTIPPAPGSRFTFRYNMVGRHFNGAMIVTEASPNERFTFEVTGPVEGRFRYEYTATAKTRTRITIFVEYHAHGLFGKAADMLFLERRNAADAEHAADQLKSNLEAEAMARIDADIV
jgi:uncharacterized protein YndB with AHSA1/START domain